MENPIFIGKEHFIITAPAIDPPKDYVAPEGFPLCCKFHKFFYNDAKDWFDRFPDCCDEHKEFKRRKPDFKKEDYLDVVDKIINTLSYTEFVIKNVINNEDWYDDITDYLEYALQSFGQPSIGGGIYSNAVKNFISNDSSVEEGKKGILLSYFEPTNDDNDESKNSDLPILFDIYTRWYKSFPFQLSYFSNIGKLLDNRFVLLKGKPKVNRYSGIAKAKVLSQKELVIFLADLTNSIFSVVDTTELVKEGKIGELEKNQLDIITHGHFLKQQELINKYIKGEKRYIKTIKKWLENEKTFFNEIVKANNMSESPKETSIQELLHRELSKYSFFDLPKVSILSESSIDKLVNRIVTSTCPFQIAMLDYLGFIGSIYDNHFRSRDKTNKCLSNILNVSARVVKGNYAVLNRKSRENKERYTAHNEIENVIKYYNSLK